MSDILRMATDNSGNTLAVGSNGLIIKSTDGGATWQEKVSGTTNGLYGVAWGYILGSSGWAVVGENGLILTSTDGEVWATITPIVSESLYAITFVGIFMAVGDAGTLIVSDDLGATWEEKSSGTTEDLLDITAGSGIYTIIGTNDTVIVGSLVTLQMEVYLEERVRVTPLESEIGKFAHVSTDQMEVVNGYNWQIERNVLHDITITERVWAMETQSETGVYNHVQEETIQPSDASDWGINFAIGGSAVNLDVAITERVRTTPVEDSNGAFAHSVSDSVGASEGNIWEYISGGPDSGGNVQYVPVVEGLIGLDIGGGVSGGFNHAITDIAGMLPVLLSIGTFNHVVTETATLPHSVEQAHRITRLVLESLTANGIMTDLHANTIKERVQLLTASTGNGIFQRVGVDTVSLQDTVLIAWLALLSESVTVTDSASRRFEIALEMVERLILTATVGSRLQALMAIAISLELLDTVQGGKGAEVSESLTLTPEALQRIYAHALLLETAIMTATPAMTMKISVPLTDVARFTTTPIATGLFRDLLTEGVAFELLFNTGDETYKGWVMNTRNFGVTEYQNYPFNSFVKIGPLYLGANSQGLYRLTGDTDAGAAIEAAVTLGITDLASDKLKRLDSIYLGFRANGNIVLKVLTESNAEYWYEAQVSTEKFHQHRIKQSRAVEAVTWQLSLVNVAGADFELRTIEFVPVILSRRT